MAVYKHFNEPICYRAHSQIINTGKIILLWATHHMVLFPVPVFTLILIYLIINEVAHFAIWVFPFQGTSSSFASLYLLNSVFKMVFRKSLCILGHNFNCIHVGTYLLTANVLLYHSLNSCF